MSQRPWACYYTHSHKDCVPWWSIPGMGCPSDLEINSIWPPIIAYLMPEDDMQLGGKLTFCRSCSNELNSNEFPPRHIVAARPPALLL